MMNQKRKRSTQDKDSDDEVEVEHIAKRHKVNVVSPLKASKSYKAPQFRSFHLHILKSLYESDDDDEDKEDQEDFQDNTAAAEVPEQGHSTTTASNAANGKLWKLARNYLRERENLIRQKKEAACLKDVHQEALLFMEEREKDALTQSPVSRPAWTRSASEPATANASTGLCPSPAARSLGFFSPQRAPTQQGSLANDSNESKTPINCFGLVATLLKTKFQSFEKSTRYFCNPYGPVLKEIETTIHTLEHELQRLKEDEIANQKQAVEDLLSRPMLLSSLTSPSFPHHDVWGGKGKNSKCALSKLETKLSLWRMLAADMKEIVVPN